MASHESADARPYDNFAQRISLHPISRASIVNNLLGFTPRSASFLIQYPVMLSTCYPPFLWPWSNEGDSLGQFLGCGGAYQWVGEISQGARTLFVFQGLSAPHSHILAAADQGEADYHQCREVKQG